MHKEATWNTYRPIAPAYDNLVRYNPSGADEIVPDLAEKWEFSADGKSLTMHLRSGVKFHSGDDFTSADAKFSVDRNRGALTQGPGALPNPPRKDLFAAIDAIDTPDPTTVVLHLKYPAASLLSTLASDYHAMYSKTWIEAGHNPGKEVNGTGPFKFKDYTQGVQVSVVKNENYWNKGLPYLDAVQTLIVPDENTALAGLRTGQQMFMDLSVSQANTIQQGIDDGSLKDRLRIELVGGVADAFWPLPQDQLVTMPGFSTDKDKERTEARQLLSDAGYPNGLTFKGMIRNDILFQPTGVAMADQFKTVGANMDIELVDPAVAYDRGVKHDFELGYFGMGGLYLNCATKPFNDERVRRALSMSVDRIAVGKLINGQYSQLAGYLTQADPDTIYGVFFITGAGRNYMGYSDAMVDDLYQKQTQTLDRNARRDLVWQIERRLLQTVPTIVTGSVKPTIWAINTQVRGFKPLASGPENQSRLDQVWLAS